MFDTVIVQKVATVKREPTPAEIKESEEKIAKEKLAEKFEKETEERRTQRIYEEAMRLMDR